MACYADDDGTTLGNERLVDADGDGLIIYEEAAAVKLLSNRKDRQMSIFAQNSILTSFRELKYFTGLRLMPAMFQSCTALKEVELPVMEEYGGMFLSCTSLPSVTVPEGAKRLGNNFCASCTSLTLLDLPSTLESIGSGLIWGVNGKTTIVCRAMNPPTVSSSLNGTPVAIYVPDGSVAIYKAASVWSSYASVIKPISAYGG